MPLTRITDGEIRGVYQAPGRSGGASWAEAVGLAWLAEAAPGHVAEVLRVSDTGVTAPEYTTVAPIEGIVRRAGGILARIHQAGAPAFGAPPPGWDCPYYIGSQQQTCRSCESWAQFYVDQRVLPFARRAFNRGNLDIAGLNDVANPPVPG